MREEPFSIQCFDPALTTDMYLLFRRAFADSPVPVNMTLRQFNSLLQKYQIQPDLSAQCLTSDKKLVGGMLLTPDSETGIVYAVLTGVDPSYQRRGIFTHMLHEMEPRWHQYGYTGCCLHVLSTNTVARQVFDRMGFCTKRMVLTFQAPRQAKPPKVPSGVSFNKFVSNRLFHVEVSDHSMIKGKAVLELHTGKIVQFEIQDGETQGISGHSLLDHLLFISPWQHVYMLNIDIKDQPLQALLKAKGFHCFLKQIEMERPIA